MSTSPQLPQITLPNTNTHVYQPSSFFITDTSSSQHRSSRNHSNDLIAQQHTADALIPSNKFTSSSRNKRRKILEKLYGITQEHTLAYNNAKKRKYLPLLSYQNNILNAYGLRDVDKQCFVNLTSKFKQIRDNANTVKQLPKVNFKIIYEHSKNEMKTYEELQEERKMRKEKKSLRQLLCEQQMEDKDEFEIEMEKMSKHKRVNTRIKAVNKSLYALPQPVVDILVKIQGK